MPRSASSMKAVAPPRQTRITYLSIIAILALLLLAGILLFLRPPFLTTAISPMTEKETSPVAALPGQAFSTIAPATTPGASTEETSVLPPASSTPSPLVPQPEHSTEAIPSGGYRVNGELVAKAEIITAIGHKRASPSGPSSEEELLQSYLDHRLLLQDAQAKAVTVTDQQVDEALAQAEQMLTIDRQAFEERITSQGWSMEEYRNTVREAMQVSSLLEQELHLTSIIATDEQVADYLNQDDPALSELDDDSNADLSADLKSRVKLRLTMQQRQDKVEDYLLGLRERAVITPVAESSDATEGT